MESSNCKIFLKICCCSYF